MIDPNNLDDLRGRLTDDIEALAELLLGAPNRALSNGRELRFGNKGSFRVKIGPKRGACADFSGDFKGGPLELIRHVRGGSWPEAVAWARDWLGEPSRVQRPKLPKSQPSKPKPKLQQKPKPKLWPKLAKKQQPSNQWLPSGRPQSQRWGRATGPIFI